MKKRKQLDIHIRHRTRLLSLSNQALTTLCYIRISAETVAVYFGTAGSSAPKHPFFQVQWLTTTLIMFMLKRTNHSA